MKKITNTLLILAVALAFSAFTTFERKTIDVNQSTIKWTGEKVTGSHTGTLQLTEGYLEMNNGAPVGGMFVVDMTSITVTDLEGKMKGKLEGHLKSDDFFGVASHATSTLKITNVTGAGDSYQVTADLTIKGITEAINFDLIMNGDENKATTILTVDRTKFDVRYGSGSFFDNLGDRTISDDFKLEVVLIF